MISENIFLAFIFCFLMHESFSQSNRDLEMRHRIESFVHTNMEIRPEGKYVIFESDFRYMVFKGDSTIHFLYDGAYFKKGYICSKKYQGRLIDIFFSDSLISNPFFLYPKESIYNCSQNFLFLSVYENGKLISEFHIPGYTAEPSCHEELARYTSPLPSNLIGDLFDLSTKYLDIYINRKD